MLFITMNYSNAMTDNGRETIIREFRDFIMKETYPCVAARAAMARAQVVCTVADHIAHENDDKLILRFIYDFIIAFRAADTQFHSAAVIFRRPAKISEDAFHRALWQRLQSLSELDATNFSYDTRVSADPSAPDFSFSLAEEAFFIIGLNPSASRPSRKFHYPAIVFNPHVQFEEMRRADRYERLKRIVRKRDLIYSGSLNPMLADFGEKSEVYQYSGKEIDAGWTCPLNIKHGATDRDSPEE